AGRAAEAGNAGRRCAPACPRCRPRRGVSYAQEPGLRADESDGAVMLADRHLRHKLRLEDERDGVRAAGRQRGVIMALAAPQPPAGLVDRYGRYDEKIDLRERDGRARRLFDPERSFDERAGTAPEG